MRLVKFLALGMLLLATLTACNKGTSTGEAPLDTATSGEITIAVDETYKPIIQAEISAFESIYTNAKINAEFLPEAECFNKLMNKEVRLVIGSRKLNDQERAVFEKWKIIPKENKFATDAIAFVVHPENPIAKLSKEALKDVLTGKITKWSQINGGEEAVSDKDITLVFDHAGSSTVRYIRDSILEGDSLANQVFAANSNPEVIDYVAETKTALGVIGVNWVSDRDSESTEEFLQKVTVLELQAPMHAREGGYFQPYQGFIALKNYPHLREVYALSREARNGLGTGFVNFIAGEKGQKVILKSGLYPAYIPVRIVEFPPKEDAEDIDKVINENREKNE